MQRGKLRLRELRKSRNLSQEALAMRLGAYQNSISRYERGVRDPGIDELIAFADFFDVSIDYLVGRTDDPWGYYSSSQSRDKSIVKSK